MRFFNRIILQTPESVELEFTLAGIGNRAFALLIDYTCLGGFLIAFLVVWLFVSKQVLDLVVQITGSANGVDLWLTAITILGGFVIYVGYFVFFESLWRGQTPGKRYTKIRVIRDDGRPIGLAQATLRALLRPFDDTLFLGVFLIALGRQEKRLGDWAAGTVVIQEEQTIAAATFPISPAAEALAAQLPEIADLSHLLPDDFAVIRDYLQRRGAMSSKAQSEVNLQLARQVKEIILLEKVPSNTTPDLFLEAVYLAYQQQSTK
ncbi:MULTISPECIES: RDD family protein [Trichocoleus]|uniref:RDD family protein n=1 Tax=Trichocoleus desertorum GB2-A4 TaxID=2933944 RepID=A0ABV0J8L7_9CYAN|nr:RDD family protein [Trichocoleus sp. FACHB-46]MBD1861135.1 RDD family protein [Trichocoleus sp. FACHB-46]